jgi:Mrp family chromosome partitioning ATPase
MLDALKRADSTAGTADEPRSAAPLGDSMAGDAAVGAAEEVPFIEVGPHRSMEASASVLACAPAPATPLPRPEARTVRTDEAHPAVASPRSVQFRAVPGRVEPRSRFAADLVAYHAPEQPAARQYIELLDAVLRAAVAHDRPATMLFTSALPRAGNTMTLLNLAITAASQQRRRVLVVDANLRQPGVAERLGLPSAPGLREALAGTVALDAFVQPTEQTNLFALTAGSPAPNSLRDGNSGLRFVAETMRSLLRQLRQRFPLVFVDGPRWDGRPEAMVLGAACDAVYLVVPEQEAEMPQTDALLQLIPKQGARLAGCILVAGQV